MNKQKILEIADFIEKLPPEQFDMDLYGIETEKCGTIACIAGWVCLNNGCTVDDNENFKDDNGDRIDPSFFAQRILEIERWQANSLFYPQGANRSATPEKAAATLRILAETGAVRWL